jgi:hypothetical protein
MHTGFSPSHLWLDVFVLKASKTQLINFNKYFGNKLPKLNQHHYQLAQNIDTPVSVVFLTTDKIVITKPEMCLK